MTAAASAARRWPNGRRDADHARREALTFGSSDRRPECRCECGLVLGVFGGGRHRTTSRSEPSLEKGSAVTHVCCPYCRLRFTPAAAAYLVACPECGEPHQTVSGHAGLVGFRLFTLEDVPHSLPEAAALSIPIPDPGGR